MGAVIVLLPIIAMTRRAACLDADLPALRPASEAAHRHGHRRCLGRQAATAAHDRLPLAPHAPARREISLVSRRRARNSGGRSARRCRRRPCRPASPVARRHCATAPHSMRPGASEPISATVGIGAAPGGHGNCWSKPRSTSKKTKSAPAPRPAVRASTRRQLQPHRRKLAGDGASTVARGRCSMKASRPPRLGMREARLTTPPSGADGRRSRRGRSATDKDQARRPRCGQVTSSSCRKRCGRSRPARLHAGCADRWRSRRGWSRICALAKIAGRSVYEASGCDRRALSPAPARRHRRRLRRRRRALLLDHPF